ncbi:WD40 repeat domain-containing protein [Sporomusa acidovorans]|uniref:Pyrrolo-quinoline quinone repeat domain-containing protein n=1 Tax=Sporomusa acidovorans (strain ATCC 49682 / DSM 3132 / Mol) TaxID=1123286 RepID=A0ABZ3IYR3_SPOA4|nr:WD40 repeat domain-containing protein [Sporomusa acidovorans]OZC17672.1 outer membrane protein assembly factor BamB [Sporomusa acidovorans DSM 3132]SDE11654.1 WD40 repeat [Sporomusa acidovorans]
MKKLITTGIALLFIGTLGALAVYIFGMNSQAGFAGKPSGTQTGAYVKVMETVLGQIEVYNYQRMGFNKGFIRFSPDGRFLAVGSETGEVLLYDTKGKLVWRKNMGLGKLAALEFSPDGRSLLVGETSQQGCLISLNSKDGHVQWRQSSAVELGVDIKEKTYPGVVAVRTDAAGMIYAVAQRYIKHADGRNEYVGRIYKFTPAGERIEIFPGDHNFDAWVSWIAVDAAGQKIAFAAANFDAVKYTYDRNLYCLDGKLENVLWSNYVDIVPPYQNVTMRTSPDMMPDGRYAAAIASDGRCFLFDGERGEELWRRSISQPQKIGGVYINATGNYSRMIGEYAVFTTGNTYNRANWQLPTPVEHPNSNSLFVFDLQGKLMNNYKFGGMIEEIAAGNKLAALAVGRNVRSKDPSVHGLYIVTIPETRLVDYAATAGPCVAAAISADGRYAAAVEAPLQLDDGQVIGEYKLILLAKAETKVLH